jgi:hypothetical protein
LQRQVLKQGCGIIGESASSSGEGHSLEYWFLPADSGVFFIAIKPLQRLTHGWKTMRNKKIILITYINESKTNDEFLKPMF